MKTQTTQEVVLHDIVDKTVELLGLYTATGQFCEAKHIESPFQY